MPKVKFDNITFDSELEVEYYKYLCELKNKGEILRFIYHPSIPIPVTKNNNYYPDFILIYSNHNIEIVECKGYSQFSYLKDNMIHNIMLQKSSDELSQWLCNNGIVPSNTALVQYKKVKYLKAYGFVDWDFKNPNTLANKRKEKILTQKDEIKELQEFKKNAERYFKYHLKIVKNEKLTKPQKEWYYKYVEELKERYS